MSLTPWENLPSTETPINAENLKNDPYYLQNQMLDLTNIKTVDYSATFTTRASDFEYVSIPTSTPAGYTLLGYIITGNGWISQVISSVIRSHNTYVVINTFSNQALTITINVKGIYAKRVNQ